MKATAQQIPFKFTSSLISAITSKQMFTPEDTTVSNTFGIRIPDIVALDMAYEVGSNQTVEKSRVMTPSRHRNQCLPYTP